MTWAIVAIGLAVLVATHGGTEPDVADALSCADPAHMFEDGFHEGGGCTIGFGVFVAEDFQDICRVVLTYSGGTTRHLAWTGRAVVEIDWAWASHAGVSSIESEGCGTWVLATHARACVGDPAPTFVDGLHQEGGCTIGPGVFVADDFQDTCRVTLTYSDEMTRSLAWVGRAVLQIQWASDSTPGLQSIESEGCGTWVAVGQSDEPPATEFGPGAYQLHSDIEPGIYESSAPAERCFWFYIRDWTYPMDDAAPIVVWLVGSPVVEIPEDTFGFYSARCGTWTKRDGQVPPTPATTFGDGSHVAGMDVAPGVYTTQGGEGMCLWYRTSPVGGNSENRNAIGWHTSEGQQVAEIYADDVGVYSEGCGEWSIQLAPDDPPRFTEFGDGIYKVGSDIAPDLYTSDVKPGRDCEWEVITGFSGSNSEVARYGLGVLRGIARIVEGDVGFVATGCAGWRRTADIDPGEIQSEFGDGEYVVGTHITPGLYVADGASVGRCLWRRLSDFTGSNHDVLGVRNPVGRVVVRIFDTDAGFESLGCGTWTLATEPDEVATWFRDGIWRVGEEVRPGLYSATAFRSTVCFWGRFSAFTGAAENLIAGNAAEQHAVVLVEASDAGIYSDGCGTWMLASSLPDREPVATFGDGVHLVGSEILPGTYHSRSQPDRLCIWSRLSGFGGTGAERIATVVSSRASIVTILESDVGIRSAGCETWVPLDVSIASSLADAAPFTDGMRVVGRDIAPGVYVASEHTSTRCRWLRLSDWTWTFGIITEKLQIGNAIAEIGVDDAGFYSEGCGEWLPAGDGPTEDAVGIIGSGALRVGIDITPGIYRSDQRFETGECKWWRLSDFSGTRDGVIAAAGSEHGDWTVEVRADDAGFESIGCGDWTVLIDVYPLSETDAAGRTYGDGVHLVDSEMLPGTYVADIGAARYRDGDFVPACRWSRVSGFSHEPADAIESGTGWGEHRVRIETGDAAFVSTNCGDWVREGE